MVHPVVRNTKSFFIYLGSWILAIVVHSLVLSYYYQILYPTAIVDALIFNLLFAIIGLGLWYTVHYSNFEKRRISGILINHLGACTFALLIWVSVGYQLVLLFYPDYPFYNEYLEASIFRRILMGSFYYVVLSLIYYLIIYYNNFQETLLKESELRTMVKESELNLLRNQIKPHFLFNSLNSISSLTLTDPEKAREMIIKLSDFFRYSLAGKEQLYTTLANEIKLGDLYLSIEKIRFGAKLDFFTEVDEKCMKARVPYLILQPLFENAVKHGVYESTHEVKILLKCTAEPGYIKIEISNNFDTDIVPRKGKGIGIENVKNRLKLLYNQDGLVYTVKKEDFFTVILFIPNVV